MTGACVVNFVMQIGMIFLDVLTRLESSSGAILTLWFVTGVFTAVVGVGELDKPPGNGRFGGTVVLVLSIVAVALSNVPEAIAASSGLARAGWASRRILRLWLLVAVVSGLSALLGFAVFDSASSSTIAFVLSFAGGAILTMLADTMMPEAFEHGGKLVGVFTTFGFGLAFAISAWG